MDSISYGIVNGQGAQSGSVELSGRVFGSTVSAVAVHSVVVWQLSKRRAGTHSALERSAMKGGGKKPFRQKGTGRARAGSSISPLWVGGAVVHGPRPRSYEKALNKKVRLAALTSVLSDAVASKRLIVVDSFEGCTGKARDGAQLLKALGARRGTSTLVVLPSDAETASLSFRNLSGVSVLPVSGLNVYDLVRHKVVVMSKQSLLEVQGEVERRFSGRSQEVSDERR